MQVPHRSVLAKLSQLAALSDVNIREIVLSKMRRLGLFSNDVVSQRGTLLDALCATLEAKMKFEKGQRDLVMLQHKFVVERANGSIVRCLFQSPFCLVSMTHSPCCSQETITSTLEAYGSATGGPSAMCVSLSLCSASVVLTLLAVMSPQGLYRWCPRWYCVAAHSRWQDYEEGNNAALRC